MSTKTMRLPPRRILTTSASANKRKERDDGDGLDGPKPSTTTKLRKPDMLRTGLEPPNCSKSLEPSPSKSNQLLAGYLAHEFLTRGTLFGQPWDPSRAESSTNPSRSEFAASQKMKGKPREKREAEPPSGIAEQPSQKYQSYVELAHLLKADGVHLPGIVNPTQLSL